MATIKSEKCLVERKSLGNFRCMLVVFRRRKLHSLIAIVPSPVQRHSCRSIELVPPSSCIVVVDNNRLQSHNFPDQQPSEKDLESLDARSQQQSFYHLGNALHWPLIDPISCFNDSEANISQNCLLIALLWWLCANQNMVKMSMVNSFSP